MSSLSALSRDRNIPEYLIRTTMLSLEDLMTANPVAFYELVQWCRDRNHQLFGNTESILFDKGLLHDSVRDIVLVAVTGEGFDLRLAEG